MERGNEQTVAEYMHTIHFLLLNRVVVYHPTIANSIVHIFLRRKMLMSQFYAYDIVSLEIIFCLK